MPSALVQSRVVDPLNVATRLDEFRGLKPGWLNGHGLAPDPSGLTWLADAFAARYPGELPPPRLYPTAEGGVQAEWRLGPRDVSVDVDLSRRTGEWHVLNLSTGVGEARTLDLNAADGWAWLAGRVRGWAGAADD